MWKMKTNGADTFPDSKEMYRRPVMKICTARMESHILAVSPDTNPTDMEEEDWV